MSGQLSRLSNINVGLNSGDHSFHAAFFQRNGYRSSRTHCFTSAAAKAFLVVPFQLAIHHLQRTEHTVFSAISTVGTEPLVYCNSQPFQSLKDRSQIARKIFYAPQDAAARAAIAQIEEVPCIRDRSTDTVDSIASEPAEAWDQPELNGLSRALLRFSFRADMPLYNIAVIGFHSENSPTQTHTPKIVVVKVLALPRYSTRA